MPSAFAIYMHRLLRSGMTPLLSMALVFGLLIHAAIFFVINPSIQITANSDTPQSQIIFSPLTADAKEQMDFANSEPLYLPTEKNFGYRARIASAPDQSITLGASPFKQFEPKFRLSETGDLRKEIPLETAFATPAPENTLSFHRRRVTAGFGKTEQPAIAMPAREAFLRVERLADGVVVFEENFSIGLTPEIAGAFWTPAAFVCAIDTFGVCGPPKPMTAPATDQLGTGNAEIDAKIRAALQKFPFAKRLQPGQYRLLIGP